MAASGKLLELLESKPDGVGERDLEEAFGHGYGELIMSDLQQLIDSVRRVRFLGRLEILDDGGGGHVYRLLPEDQAAKYAGLSCVPRKRHRVEAMMVLQAVERSGNQGIWTRHLKQVTRLQQQQLNKHLKRLEKRKLIKSVKSIAHKNRKMYMAYDVEPSREVTGGPWYSEQELDKVFIEHLRKYVYKLLGQSPHTRVELVDAITSAGFSRVALGREEVQQILDTLIYDGKVERVPPSAAASTAVAGSAVAGVGGVAGRRPRATQAASLDERETRGSDVMLDDEDEDQQDEDAAWGLDSHPDRIKYKRAALPTAMDALTTTPCGVCPVIDRCTPEGVISPERCVYLTAWLEF